MKDYPTIFGINEVFTIELTTYEKQGYEIGGLPRTALRYINNGEIEKRVREETLLEYINNGWKLGRTKHTRKKRWNKYAE